VRDSVDLDGGGGTDMYFIYSWGSLAVGTHDYKSSTVLDSGAKDNGQDTLQIDVLATRQMSSCCAARRP